MAIPRLSEVCIARKGFVFKKTVVSFKPVQFEQRQPLATFGKRRILSDINGRIKQVVLATASAIVPSRPKVVNDLAFQLGDYLRFESILEETAPDVQVVIVSDDQQYLSCQHTNFSLIDLLVKYPKKLKLFLNNFPEQDYTVWQQDKSTIFEDSTFFPVNPIVSDSPLPEPLLFGQILGLNLLEGPEEEISAKILTNLRGANVISGDNYLFYGPQIIDLPDIVTTKIQEGHWRRQTRFKWMKRYLQTGKTSPDFEAARKTLERALELIAGGRELVGVSTWGGAQVYMGDLDIVFTYLGGKDVLVADPSLAREKRKELQNLGFHQDPQLVKIDQIIQDQFVTQERADGIARYLEREGFNVGRLPFLNSMIATWEKRHVHLPILSYNNALIEIFDNEKIVYLPTYQIEAEDPFGFKDLDEKAAEVYHKAGFNKVIFIDGLQALSYKLGILRCSTKITRREQGDS